MCCCSETSGGVWLRFGGQHLIQMAGVDQCSFLVDSEEARGAYRRNKEEQKEMCRPFPSGKVEKRAVWAFTFRKGGEE